MKKIVSVILSAFMVLSLAACGNNETESTSNNFGQSVQADSSSGSIQESTTENNAAKENNSDLNNTSATGESNILITYFAVPETDGVDTVAGASRVVVDGEVLGNTQYIAQLIQQSVGGELFAIETVQEYPGLHEPLLEFACNEKGENARPELASKIENLDSYDVIFIGYPIWNADLPMPLYTFLEEYDFSGKTIVPFTTHGGSSFSRTIDTVGELQANATVISDGLSISRNDVEESQNEVTEWTQALELTK